MAWAGNSFMIAIAAEPGGGEEWEDVTRSSIRTTACPLENRGEVSTIGS
ncbi:MAG: hypothetical protein AB4352_03170 [Hormoscilla sp.]